MEHMLQSHNLKLYRKRVIPAENLLLADDVIVRLTPDLLITSWRSIHPKPEFSHGCSCYYLQRGYKVSRIYRPDNSLLRWYCDIVEYHADDTANTLTAQDLLADVVISPDGSIRVLDLDELADAVERQLISTDQLLHALRSLHSLLGELEANGIERLDAPLAELHL